MPRKTLLPLLAVASLICLAAPQVSQAAHAVSKWSFLPPNNLRISVNSVNAQGITHEQFNEVIDEVASIYAPIIAAQGGVLVINRLWNDPTVNSDAEEQHGHWIINSYGGLARDKHITQDGFALVACHEMGHHLGGAPKYGGSDQWASDEGEADYFSTSKCLHRVFADSGSKRFTRMSADQDEAVAEAACAKAYSKNQTDQAVCVRSSIAGLSVTGLLAELSQDQTPAHFSTPDPAVVKKTNDDHPAPQCRLDTYFQGALCNKSYTVDMNKSDPAIGACVLSQNYTTGIRPLCWYKPTSEELPPSNNISSTLKTGPLSELKNPALWQRN